jgi:hypothetical protein
MTTPSPPPGGLCDTCLHCKTIRSPRGSVFRLCLLHDTDPRFAKYPRVPVIQCPGYDKRPHEQGPARD